MFDLLFANKRLEKIVDESLQSLIMGKNFCKTIQKMKITEDVYTYRAILNGLKSLCIASNAKYMDCFKEFKDIVSMGKEKLYTKFKVQYIFMLLLSMILFISSLAMNFIPLMKIISIIFALVMGISNVIIYNKSLDILSVSDKILDDNIKNIEEINDIISEMEILDKDMSKVNSSAINNNQANNSKQIIVLTNCDDVTEDDVNTILKEIHDVELNGKHKKRTRKR